MWVTVLRGARAHQGLGVFGSKGGFVERRRRPVHDGQWPLAIRGLKHLELVLENSQCALQIYLFP